MNEQVTQLNESAHSNIAWHIGDSLKESVWGYYLELLFESANDEEDELFYQLLMDEKLMNRFDYVEFMELMVKMGVKFAVDGEALGILNN